MSLETWVNQENIGSPYKYACADCSRSNELIQASTFKNLFGTTYAFCSYCITKDDIINPNEDMLEWLNRNADKKQPILKTKTITEKVWISNPNLRIPKDKEDLKNCLCPFCMLSENSTEKSAETFTEYNLPACNACDEFIQIQFQYLSGIEIEWLINECRTIKQSIQNNGFHKLITKTITYYDE